MKLSFLIFSFAICSIYSSSCSNYTPPEDNNMVMMRPTDIQSSADLKDRQKYTNEPTHKLNILRYLKELFQPSRRSTEIKIDHSTAK